jgi:hypothetical protein
MLALQRNEEFLLDRFAKRLNLWRDRTASALRRSAVRCGACGLYNRLQQFNHNKKNCVVCRVSGRGPAGSGWAAFFDKNARNTGMKRVIFVLIVAASSTVVGCAESDSDLVAKINAAYHTRFYVPTPNDTPMGPGAWEPGAR